MVVFSQVWRWSKRWAAGGGELVCRRSRSTPGRGAAPWETVWSVSHPQQQHQGLLRLLCGVSHHNTLIIGWLECIPVCVFAQNRNVLIFRVYSLVFVESSPHCILFWPKTAWTFWVYSLHSRVKFTTQQTWICIMGGASAGRSSLVAKCIPVFVKVGSSIVQLWVPTYNYFVLHCCLGFSASALNDVTARASSWLVNVPRISAKVQIFQLARIHATSFARIAPQDCLSHLCIDLTCKSFARNA